MAPFEERKRRPLREDKIFRWENDGSEATSLMSFMESRRPDSKRSDIKKWMKFGHLKVDGVVVTAFNSPIVPGAVVEFNSSRPFTVFHHPRIELVYEDDDVLVINKGYGLLSVSTLSHKKETNAYEIMRNYVKEVNPRNKLFIVHRLDRDTSGLMMFAKSEEAQEILRHNWNNIILERLYVAVLE